MAIGKKGSPSKATIRSPTSRPRAAAEGCTVCTTATRPRRESRKGWERASGGARSAESDGRMAESAHATATRAVARRRGSGEVGLIEPPAPPGMLAPLRGPDRWRAEPLAPPGRGREGEGARGPAVAEAAIVERHDL